VTEVSHVSVPLVNQSLSLPFLMKVAVFIFIYFSKTPLTEELKQLFYVSTEQVLVQEVGENVQVQTLLSSSSGWRGRAQQISALQLKVNSIHLNMQYEMLSPGIFFTDFLIYCS